VPLAHRDVVNLSRNDEFSEFYGQSAEKALKAMRVVALNRSRAEDATAEAFLRAFNQWKKVRRLDKKLGWVIRVAINIYRDEYKQVGRHEVLADLLEVSGTRWQDYVDPDLQAAIGKLPHQQQSVVVLRFYCGCDTAEIAGILGISEDTVRVHKMRALERLRDLLDPVATR
jgi:RNA polymerase sigma factor (sigma-70 family)